MNWNYVLLLFAVVCLEQTFVAAKESSFVFHHGTSSVEEDTVHTVELVIPQHWGVTSYFCTMIAIIVFGIVFLMVSTAAPVVHTSGLGSIPPQPGLLMGVSTSNRVFNMVFERRFEPACGGVGRGY